MAKEGVGYGIKLACHAAFVHKQAHQNKQRDHRQTIVLCGVRDLPSNHGQGRAQTAFIKQAAAAFIGKAQRADKAHGEYDRHSQKDEDKNNAKTDQCSGHIFSSLRSFGATRVNTPAITIANAASVMPDAMNHMVRYCGSPRYSVTSP